jgi:uncharacterized protein involved in outer membrane biogenesis
MDAARPPPAPVRSASARWLRRLAWVLAGIVLTWAALWLAVPALKGVAERRLGDTLGREVRIGAVEFAPWSLALTLRELRIAGATPADPPLLEVKRLHADAELSSLRHRAPVLAALEIDAPRLRLARLADGRTDVDDVLRRLAPPAPAASAAAAPARLALYNVKLEGGEVQLDDRMAGQQHALRELAVELPFLSNLPVHVDVHVQPRLAFQLNGARFDSGAQAKPFTATRDTNAQLRIADLDIKPWLPYLPQGLPVRPQRAHLSADLDLRFALADDGTPQVVLRGEAAARDVAIADHAGAPLVVWQRLQLKLADVQPLRRSVALDLLRLEGAVVDLRRSADGRLASLPPQPPAGDGASWDLRIGRVEVADSRVHWQDRTTTPPAALQLADLQATLNGLQSTAPQPAALQLSARLVGGDTAAPISAEGQVSAQAANVALNLRDLELAALAPYMAQTLVPRLAGRLSAQGRIDWAAGETTKLALAFPQARVEALRIDDQRNRRDAGAAWQSLAVRDLSVDVGARRVRIAAAELQQPQLQLRRAAGGDWNVLGWLRTTSPAVPAPAATPAWQLQLDDFTLRGGRVAIDDAGPATPVRVQASALDVSLQGLAWPAAGQPPARGRIALRLAGTERGAQVASAQWQGRFSAEPVQVRGALRVQRWPVHRFEPYFGAALPTIALLRGEASWQGDIDIAQQRDAWAISARGDALLGDVQVHARSADGVVGDELLTWNTFALNGLQATLAPAAKPRIEVAEAVLSDFYSRLIVTEQGRFNLQDVAGAPVAAASAPAPAVAPSPAPAASAAELPLALSVGATRLVQGRVDFTDRFIRPNYSAQLSELNGRLGAFRSGSREMAAIELRGRAAGTAALEIIGSLNPTAEPLALDIRAKATDLELAPFSPYSGRYAGYAIERGKLSMDVHYKIEPDGKLDAKNQVVLNQLTFGDKVDSPDATKLPVRLALALLADRNGVIDINLPVSGSINDPQFSVFGLVLKIIGNLLVKALTAPFSLLAGGGANDLSLVAFVPGTATPTDAGRAAIDQVAKALADRPALQMTVTGTSDPVSEREAAQRAALETRLRAEQRRERARSGAPADASLPPLQGDERARIVKRVYDDTRLPDKPRNFIGLAKSLPAAEMEALLRAAQPASADTARELALQRGLAVRDALVAKGLPSERLFLAAPKLKSDDDKDWSPRAQLSLATR